MGNSPGLREFYPKSLIWIAAFTGLANLSAARPLLSATRLPDLEWVKRKAPLLFAIGLLLWATVQVTISAAVLRGAAYIDITAGPSGWGGPWPNLNTSLGIGIVMSVGGWFISLALRRPFLYAQAWWLLITGTIMLTFLPIPRWLSKALTSPGKAPSQIERVNDFRGMPDHATGYAIVQF